MKTAAVVVVLLALFGMFPKKKKHHPPPATPVAVSQAWCASPDSVQVDPQRVERIVRFGRQLYRNPVVSEDSLRSIAGYIVKYSGANCVEPELAAALIARESGFNPRAVSSSGAKGLGQLIDSTARNLGVSDPFDPEQNVRGSISYFKTLLDRWQGYPDQVERALASYNMGPRVVESRGPGGASRFVSDILKYREKMLSL